MSSNAARPGLLLAAAAVVGSAALAFSGPSATAAATPRTCLLANGQEQIQGAPNQPTGAPMIVTASASSPVQNTAMTNAISKWTQQAAARGFSYQYWTKAANRYTPCTSSKPAFQWIYTCTAQAQPCK
jgi:hypothetical protein